MVDIHEPDELLIKRARKNGGSDLNTLISYTAPYVVRICTKWCRPPLDPLDVSQESLIRVATKLDTYRSESKFFTWVYTVSYRTFLDQYRELQRRLARDASVESPQTFSDDPGDAGIILQKALSNLDEDMAIILILIDATGATYEEASRQLSIPIGTVRSRLARARIHLKKYLVSTGTFTESGTVISPKDES